MSEEDIIQRAIQILESRLKLPKEFFTSSSHAFDFLKLSMSELEYESFRVLFLDSQHGLLAFKEMFKGTIDAAAVYPREIVKASLSFNAAAVILTHNHPSGLCEPSEADKSVTKRIQNALNLVDVRVLDHVVVGKGHPYSFSEHGLI